MAKTYRDVAIDQMIATVEEALSSAIDWWGDLPPSMKEAIDKFRVQLGAALDSVEFVRKALDRRIVAGRSKAACRVIKSGVHLLGDMGYLRFWHKAEMLTRSSNVRSWGQSGH